MKSPSSSLSNTHICEAMEKAIKIMRSSVHAFLATYHTFASIATVLVFPASAATLLSKALPTPTSPAFLQLISLQKSNSFDVFHASLSRSTFSFLLTLPFSLTFLCLAKASIIHAAHRLDRRNLTPPISPPFHRLCCRIAFTQIFNSLLILSANAIFILTMPLFFNAVELLGFGSRSIIIILSDTGLIIYSTINAIAFVICNLASLVAGMEDCSPRAAGLKSFELVRDGALVALSLALPANLGMAAIEGVFQVRVTGPYHEAKQFDPSLMCEGFTIIYMHSIFTVLDIIITCCFYKYCKYGLLNHSEGQFDYEDEMGIEDGKVNGAIKLYTFA